MTQINNILNVFEIKCWRIMSRIRWRNKQTNQSILNVDKRLCRFFGRIIRERALDRTLVLGRTNGYRRKDRPTTRRPQQISQRLELPMVNVVHSAEDWQLLGRTYRFMIITMTTYHQYEGDDDDDDNIYRYNLLRFKINVLFFRCKYFYSN